MKKSKFTESQIIYAIRQVRRILDQIIDLRGRPVKIRVEDREASGPEFTSINLVTWCEENGI